MSQFPGAVSEAAPLYAMTQKLGFAVSLHASFPTPLVCPLNPYVFIVFTQAKFHWWRTGMSLETPRFFPFTAVE